MQGKSAVFVFDDGTTGELGGDMIGNAAGVSVGTSPPCDLKRDLELERN
jgi:hypothetical protein